LSLAGLLQQAQIRWHGVKLDQPDWGYDSYSLAFTVRGSRGLFRLILNAYWEPLEFELPRPPGRSQNGWQRVIDTYLDAPDDFCSVPQAPRIDSPTDEDLPKYVLQPRSVVLLVAETR
jgi:isoamylase